MNSTLIIESSSALTSWSFLTSSLLIIVSLTLAHFYHENTDKAKLANQIPGPRALPFIGNALLVLGLKSNHHLYKRTLKLSEKFGRVVRGWAGWRLIVFLMDPRDAEVILNSSVHIEKAEEYKFFEPWLGKGLLISTGDKWRSHRKLIAPTFHLNILKNFVGIFSKNSMKVVERLNEEVGKEIDIHDFMAEATVDILLETVMGFKTSKSKVNSNSGYNYAMAVMRMCDIIHQRQIRLYYRINAIFNMSKFKKIQEESLKMIHGMTKKVLAEKKEIFYKNLKAGKLPSPSLQEIIKINDEADHQVQALKTIGLRDDLDDIDENDIGEKRRLAFLDLMIETSHFNPTQLSQEEIKQQVDTIMFEGHDTTAAGSSFTLCMLGIYQDIQEKVLQEQLEIFGGSFREATYADTIEMKYLERVILETLRLYPPVPVIARKVNEDVKLASKNYTIPAGTTVVIGIYKLHRNPENYENPEKFDPDNFLPEKAAARNYYSFVPFSAGPRSCVGRKYALLKLKVLLSTIIRNFRIKSNCREKDFKLIGDIILKRADGFRIILESR